MENGNYNGNGLAWRTYAISGLAGLVMLFGGMWIQSIAARLSNFELNLHEIGRAKDERTIIIQNLTNEAVDTRRRLEQLERRRPNN